jgi:DsbC/DsbD-like thiol-disulfide interchange protein
MGLFRLSTALAFLVLASSSLLSAPNTKARLLLSAESAQPGETIIAAVELRMQGNWHTYWRNPGDAGQATEIAWKLPAGITAGKIQWPIPEKNVTPPLTTYVYHNNVVLVVPLHLAKDVAHGSKDIQATVSWMECDSVCALGKSGVNATLVIGGKSTPGPGASLVAEAQKRLPQSGQILAARGRWLDSAQADSRQLVIQGLLPKSFQFIDFYPYPGEEYEFEGQTELIELSANKWAVKKKVAPFSGDWPRHVRGLIVAGSSASAIAEAYEIELSLE